MKILVVSRLYPPNYLGGYEIGCCDFVNYVRKNTNYFISVLTSNYGTFKGTEAHVKRKLITDLGYSNKNRVYVFFKNWHREIQNRLIFKETIKKFRPNKI